MEDLLHGLKAAAEPTRLRILSLCANGELTVSDLVRILGQSQPRVSRHLRLLVEAGLLERNQEGNWAWYRLAERSPNADLAARLMELLPADDMLQSLDRKRLDEIKAERAREAEAYFRRNAERWSEIRALHADLGDVDEALRRLIERAPIGELLDIGTGTGRVLELASADVGSAIGIDQSRDMLTVARANLDRAGLRNCQVRQADMYQLPFEADRFDAVTLHLVLHYAEHPGRVIAEAARVLAPGGRIIIVDFAPHSMTSLLEQHAHRWPGFSNPDMRRYLRDAGLAPETPIELAGNPLTVCLWAANRSRSTQRGRRAQETILETAS